MIARAWTARATVEGGEAYLRFFAETLVSGLKQIAGHRGAEVLVAPHQTGVEITVLTFWESMDAVARFAGATPSQAVVEPEAQAVLLDYDREARHLTLRIDSRHQGNVLP